MTSLSAQSGVSRDGADSAPRSGSRAPNRAVLIWTGLLTLAFFGLFYRWFHRQHLFSMDALEDWGHAYFVPLISGYMIWQRREELKRIPLSPFWPALAPLVAGILSYFFGIVLIQNHMFQGFAIILTLYSALLMLLGPKFTGVLFLPVAFLVFGMTVSEKIMLGITWPMQLIASDGAWLMLSIIGMVGGFDVEVMGNTLTIIGADGEAHPLNVAEACSGMRMVVAFIALAGAVALLASREWWQRSALLMLSIPVAVIMNVVRVAVLGLLTLVDPNLAAGDAHTFIGTLLLFPALGAFMFIVWALDKSVSADRASKPAPVRPSGNPVPMKLNLGASVTVFALLAASAGGMGFAINAYDLHLTKIPIYPEGNRTLRATLPTETEHWRQLGQDTIESPDIVKVLGTENYVTRTFIRKATEDSDPSIIDFHAAYYTGMIDTVPHVPERCFVGGGLQQGGGTVTVPIPLDTARWRPDTGVEDPELAGRVNRVRLSNRWSASPGKRVRLPADAENIKLRTTEFLTPDNKPFYAGYFFVANGGTVSSAEGIRLLAFNLTDDYAYYMKVQFTSQTAGSAEELAEEAGLLLDDILGDLMLCVPDWVEVREGRYPADAGEGSQGS